MLWAEYFGSFVVPPQDDIYFRQVVRLNAWAAVSAIWRPMASELVAPGLGALRTWTMRLVCVLKTKSSTRAPSGPRAWARTPLGPGSRSARVSSGTKTWSDFKKASLEK